MEETDRISSSRRQNRLPPIPSSGQLVVQKMDRTTFADSRLQQSQSFSKLSAIKSPRGHTVDFAKSSVLKTLKADLGSLQEFLNYDMGLKKPEELFKCNLRCIIFSSQTFYIAITEHNPKKNSSSQNDKDKLLMQFKQEQDNRNPKTVRNYFR